MLSFKYETRASILVRHTLTEPFPVTLTAHCGESSKPPIPISGVLAFGFWNMSSHEEVDASYNGDCGVESQNGSKRPRKNASDVWNDFVPLPPNYVEYGDNLKRAECKHCHTVIIADSSYGTNTMKRHISKCPARTNHDVRQMLMSSSFEKGNVELRHPKLNQEQHRDNMVIAILLHEYPFQFVEHEGTRKMISYLNPDVKHITRNTIKADVLKFYRREKKKLFDILQLVPGRVSLTSDLWTSITTDGYISLTAHFIDKDWVLQKRILNFCYMPTPHTGILISENISSLLNEWNLEKKLFSITLDNASSNDSFVDFLKNHLYIRNGMLLHGEFFHVRCCAHILNLIVQDGLKEIDSGIYKIRESVKFVKGSQSRKKKFHDCAQQMGIHCKKGLRQDVSTRWNSTYLMLEAVLYYRNAFSHLALSDSNYHYCPTLEEWNHMENMVKFLKVFYDVTNIFSDTLYPTSNLFFLEMWRIQCIFQDEARNLGHCGDFGSSL